MSLKYFSSFEMFFELYCREEILKKATNIGRTNLISLGTCFGKFSKTGKFKLQITALDFLAPYAKVSAPTFSQVTP